MGAIKSYLKIVKEVLTVIVSLWYNVNDNGSDNGNVNIVNEPEL